MKLSKRKSVLIAAAVAGCAQFGLAANFTWDGGGSDSNFSTAQNWVNDVAPNPGDALFFNGLTNLSPNNDFIAGTTFGALFFNNAASTFNLNGNAITLQGGVFDKAAVTQNINLNLTFDGNNSVSSSAASTTLNLQQIDRTTTGVANFVVPSGGTITTTTANTAGMLGAWTSINGTDFAANDGSGNVVAYTGYTNAPINSILHGAIDPAANLQINQTGTVIIDADNAASTTDINTIVQRDPTDANIKIGVGNTLRLGQIGAILVPTSTVFASNPWTISASGVGSATQGGATLTAGGTPNTAGQIIINANGVNNNSNVSVDANIADNGSGAVAVIKTGLGAIKFRGHNTYSGGTYIENGRLQFAGQEDVGGTANGDGFGTGPVYISPGGQFYDSDTSTVPNDFFIAGSGGSFGISDGALRIKQGTLSGKITLTGDAIITASGGGPQTNTATFTGQITDTGNGYNLTFDNLLANGNVILANTSANPNNWRGNTTLGAGTLKLFADEQIPDGTGKGNLFIPFQTVFDLHGHSETINGLNNANGTVTINGQPVPNAGTISTSVAGNATLILGGNDQTASFSGNIADISGTSTLSLIKIGAGTQTLNGTNAWHGSTTINAGALAIGSINTSAPLIVNSSGLFAGNGQFGAGTISSGRIGVGLDSGAGNIGSLSFSTLTTNTGTLDVDLGGPSIGEMILATGAATLGGSITINPYGTPSAGTYTILKAASIAGLGSTTFAVSPIPTLPHSRPSSAAVSTTATTINLVVTGGGRNITWTGSQNANWDYAAQNWTDSIAVGTETFFDGDLVTLPDLADAAKRNITLTTNIQPGSINVFNSAGNDYTLSGSSIVGAGSLIKDGPAGNAGTLVVLNNNSYLGGTTISNGVLQVGNGGSLGSGIVTNNGTLIFDRGDASTFNNVINGTGALVKNGSGTLTLAGFNNYSGPTLINAGMVVAANSLALGDQSTFTSIIIAPNAALNMNGSLPARQHLFIQGAGPDGMGVLLGTGMFGSITLNNDATISGAQTFSTGTGSSFDLQGHALTFIGNSSLTFGQGTFTGGNININQGTLYISGANIPTATGSIHFAANTNLIYGGGTVARPIFFDGNGTINPFVSSILQSNISFGGNLTFINTSSTGTMVLSGSFAETGGAQKVAINGSFVRVIYNGTTSYTGGTTITAGTLQLGNGTLAPNGGIGGGNVSDNANLEFHFSNTLTINNNISGSGAIYQTGTGTTILGGALSYAGSTNVSAGKLITNSNFSGGTLSITGGLAQVAQKATANDPSGTTVIKNLSIATGKQLDLTNNSMVIDYTSIGTLDTTIRQHLQNNRLFSSTHTTATTLGYADNALLGLTTFSGVSVDSTSLLIKYTYGGDTNLDGKVDVTDLGALASHWQQTGDWLAGDFNYDGSVNVTDLGILASNWQAGVGSPLGVDSFQQALAEVGLPEPSALGFLACLAFLLPRRRNPASRSDRLA